MKYTALMDGAPRWIAALGLAATAACGDEATSSVAGSVTAPEAPAQTLFTAEVPQFTDAADGTSYDLGLKLRALAQGRIYALRYYKAPSEALPAGVGFHLGKVYGPDGELLGVAKFEGETASGWQEAPLRAPIALGLGKTYTVVVDTYSHYVATLDAFAQPLRRGKLEVVADGTNGVYGPIWEPPTSSYRSSNYFRDVVFSKLVSVNAGGPAVGWFNGDAFGSGDSGRSTTPVANDVPVNVSGVAHAAPPAVYRTARQCTITDSIGCFITITGIDADLQPTLTPGASYEVRLHFAEIFGAQPGQRQFNVQINQQPVLTSFDIIAEAGTSPGAVRPVVRSFVTTATNRFGSGEIAIQLIKLPNNAFPMISGIEIIPRP